MKDTIEMLSLLGAGSLDDLFSDIPPSVRVQGIQLPQHLSEDRLFLDIKRVLDKNISTSDFISFLGNGIYDNYIPSSVSAITSRSEFYTSYTPYQPEASQGILQAVFEYQSLISELTGMEVVNSSLYDWPTALGEAALMAASATRKKVILIPKALHWEKKKVLETYTKGHGLEIKEVDYNEQTGRIDIDQLKERIDEDTAAVYIENPNIFGVFEDDILSIKEDMGKALLIAGVNALSLPLVKSPAEYDADIVVGEGQPLGLPQTLGGPHLGIFACKKRLARRAPGRLVGLTEDVNGNRAYCVTLQTREQHIRREKATSNICTNQSLCALQAAVYMSIMGGTGLHNIAVQMMERAHKLAGMISSVSGFKAPAFSGSFFNEFTVQCPESVGELNVKLLEKGIFGGLSLRSMFPELEDVALFSVAGRTTDEDVDRLIEALEEVA